MASFRGFFGKLPARGDFVSAGPPSDFVSRWDTWVSRTLPAALAAAGEDWMEAPAKRIRFAPGVYAADTVTGVVLPSVDINSAERLGHTAITEAMPPDVLARRLANIPPRGHTAAISPVMYDAVAFTIMMTGGLP